MHMLSQRAAVLMYVTRLQHSEGVGLKDFMEVNVLTRGPAMDLATHPGVDAALAHMCSLHRDPRVGKSC